ncbi:IS701 family transposase [Streptomyces sp. NPDC093094]|uniref:IS701 family transposase n=1 Tax=Streptomyces sp. NPDC093094 TaxID=3366026 RepID=UPI00381F1E62
MDLELEELFLRTGARFARVESRRRMRDCVRGLLGPVGRKNSRWDADSLRDGLQAYVAEQLGTPNGVLIIDDTGFVKKGITSAGVQRQHSGTAGRTENCQTGVFAAHATTRGHALVDRKLCLPKSWTDDRARCHAAKVPDEREFATKNALAATIIRRALASPLPIAWVTADAPYGQDNRFAGCWKHPASATSWPFRSPSSPWPARALTWSSSRPRPGVGAPFLRSGREGAARVRLGGRAVAPGHRVRQRLPEICARTENRCHLGRCGSPSELPQPER